MKISLLLLVMFVSSCSTFKERNKTRKLQTQILQKITTRTTSFSECAKKTNVFDNLNLDRVRVELNVTLNNRGEIQKFQTDSQKYPDKFVDCLYGILDKISFPKLEKNEVVKFTQPFIFKRL